MYEPYNDQYEIDYSTPLPRATTEGSGSQSYLTGSSYSDDSPSYKSQFVNYISPAEQAAYNSLSPKSTMNYTRNDEGKLYFSGTSTPSKFTLNEFGGIIAPPLQTSSTGSWGAKGWPDERSALTNIVSSGRNLGLRGYAGGLGVGRVRDLGVGGVGKPMPYFKGLTAPDGTQISRWDSNYWKMPDKPVLNIPTYTPIARNEGRISELAQKAGAVGLGKLGRALNTALSQARGVGDSPMAEQTTRNALRGYGEGLDSVMGQAQQTGLQQYEQEYKPLEEANRINYEGQMKSALADYQSETQRINAMYEAALKDYFGR